MAAFNPYDANAIVTQEVAASNYFGLIASNTEAAQEELHGYEVTLSGRLVLPELCSRHEAGKLLDALATAC